MPRSAVITLMSDGHSNCGRNPLSVVRDIKDRLANRVNIVSAACGSNADEETLIRIASDPEEGFRSADSAEELRDFFEASILARDRPV